MPLGKKNTARNNALSFDARAGLGYGTLEPKFHLPKKTNDEFPYMTPDNHEDDENPELTGDELDQFVSRINQGIHITDFMSKKKTDPFYYAAGNTSLGEMANSLVPMPDLYKNREKGVTGGVQSQAGVHSMYDYPSRSAGRTITGTEHGYAHPLPPIDEFDPPAYTLADIADNQEDENQNVKRLRQLIAAIVKEQEINHEAYTWQR